MEWKGKGTARHRCDGEAAHLTRSASDRLKRRTQNIATAARDSSNFGSADAATAANVINEPSPAERKVSGERMNE